MPISRTAEHPLAQIYDRLGDVERSLSSYERFLDDWKDADPDIPEVILARERFAALQAEQSTP